MPHPERELIISILAEAFKQNPRIQSMIKRTHQSRHMHTLAEYACYIMGKHQGIYLSEDKSTVLMYYRNSQYHRSLKDYLKYGWAFFRAVIELAITGKSL